MSEEHPNLIRLKGSVQQYDWGKKGSASLVARLSRHALGPDFSAEETKSYAEVWMGTHQNGPAHLFDDPSKSLYDLIASNPQHYLGDAVMKNWKGETHVPFLFKILSIEKALPLQVHPDRALAEELARQDPDTFVDPNHKPEIAVCIGDPLDGGECGEGVAFTGFVGFKPVDDIGKSVVSVPELRQAIGDEEAVAAFTEKPSRDTLKSIYGALLSRPPDAIAPLVRALVDRISRDPGTLEPETAQLVRTVDAQYPGDVGVLSTVFFLNFVKLRRGEAVYIGADEVHAYLAGDIVECMAASDNVLNAAFVPRRAAQTAAFVRALTFTARDAAHWRLLAQPYAKSSSGRTLVYDPPVEEFVVLGTRLEGAQRETLAAVDGPTIGIVTAGAVRVAVKGEVLDLPAGAIVYVVPGKEITLELAQADGAQSGEVWWAAAGV